MTPHDPLESLLKQADASASTPRMPSDFSQQILSAAAHRPKNLPLLITFLLLTTTFTIIHFSHRAATFMQARLSPSPPVLIDQQTLKSLQSQIAIHQIAIQTLLASERLSRAQAALEFQHEFPPDRALAERAASAVLYQADHAPAPQAEKSYAQILHYFPDTFSARIAKQKLQQLHKEDPT